MKKEFTITVGIKSLEALYMFYDYRTSIFSSYENGTDLQKQIYHESKDTLKQIEKILAELPKNENIEMRKALNNVVSDNVKELTDTFDKQIKELEK